MMNNYFRISFLIILAVVIIAKTAWSQGGDYRLQPEDVLSITVYEHDDLATKARVSNNGEISFPLLGKVMAAGMTVQEIEDYIKTALEKDFLVKADTQVFIEEYHVKQVSVLGAVAKPGKYDMNTEKETTVLEAIALADGFSDVAAENGTKIIRTSGEEKITIPVKISEITKKGKKEEDVALEAGDIIFVPESFF